MDGETEAEKYPERQYFDNTALANAFLDDCAGQRNCTANITVSQFFSHPESFERKNYMVFV